MPRGAAAYGGSAAGRRRRRVVTWTARTSPDQSLTLIELEGPITSAALQRLVARAVRQQEGNPWPKILLDAGRWVASQSAAEVYGLPALFEARGLHRRYRIAVVYPQLDQQLFFLETVCLNVGYQLRLFPDIPRALAWLEVEPAALGRVRATH